ncbi:hypothetical protein EC973_000713 [Apophysomyces ossiformis]|uniref:Uncharacterized protein n=1 Tax=Apophysomyces ossiformis TaxID=679940 RepID=A0A8H7ESG3_9FUNG|nr:hypothetical protein EC973_000713 [Apophysomyces ossiformis]
MSNNPQNEEYIFRTIHSRCFRLSQAYNQFLRTAAASTNMGRFEYAVLNENANSFSDPICDPDNGRIQPQICSVHGPSCSEEEKPTYEALKVEDLKDRGKLYYEAYKGFVQKFSKSQSLNEDEQRALNDYGLEHLSKMYSKEKDQFEIQGKDAAKMNDVLRRSVPFMGDNFFKDISNQ